MFVAGFAAAILNLRVGLELRSNLPNFGGASLKSVFGGVNKYYIKAFISALSMYPTQVRKTAKCNRNLEIQHCVR